ncbi:MAG: Myo-inositol-monophosphatase [Candidatus Roizmanbacteria bacterium GW2011_GWA2_34_18]|uniref:Myo-inositol-monophosphatase n=1 Tax=Candidatus Roizmanbacteria bacterium GW2011_GWA2_34_18 TaxID=1618477 RepID=A0A0G0BCL4_9BACT|nr:MAG: Myo-inositol-monophosphatase [Candidatus Roizmanbacteria bacterium GW2011_GWA2_34_18]
MNDYKIELEFAKQLAIKAGGIITKNFLHSTITTKSNLTPVTETDLAVSKLVIEEVKKNFPNHEVFDEELQHEKNDAEFLWVCDPVDGTIPFSHHIPTSMFSLALCHNGEPVVAVTYDPFMKRLLYTKTDSSSCMNDKEIRVKSGKFISGEFIFGIPYWNKDFDTNKYFKLIFDKKIIITFVESIVYQSMLVATGISKAMVMTAANPWDRAATKMIIENAGGICTDENDKRLTVFGNPQYFIATNKEVHDEIMEIVQQCLHK